MTALDGFTGYGYLGLCPQMANARQRYRFTLYAIKAASIAGVTPEAEIGAVFTAIRNNALSADSSVTLTGTQIQMR